MRASSKYTKLEPAAKGKPRCHPTHSAHTQATLIFCLSARTHTTCGLSPGTHNEPLLQGVELAIAAVHGPLVGLRHHVNAIPVMSYIPPSEAGRGSRKVVNLRLSLAALSHSQYRKGEVRCRINRYSPTLLRNAGYDTNSMLHMVRRAEQLTRHVVWAAGTRWSRG